MSEPALLSANPFRDLSRGDKIRIGVGVGVAALLGVGAWWLYKKPSSGMRPGLDRGIVVDDLCVNATITDPEKLRRYVEDVYDQQVAAGVTDPFEMTHVFFQGAAPQCVIHPRIARSPKEAEFFLTVFLGFLEQLEADDLIDDNESRAKLFEALAWASRGGWQPAEDGLAPLLGGE